MTELSAVHDLDPIDELAYRATGHYVTGANPDRLAGIFKGVARRLKGESMNKVYSGNMIRNTEALNHWHKQMPTEPALEPDLPIIDAHHHLWDIPALANQYLLNDLLADIGQGHYIIATVYVEAHAMYRREGPEHMKPVGEVEFANGVASMAASGNYGNCKVANAIVAHADLMLGSQVEEVLAKQSEVAGGRLRGIRYVTPFDDSELRNFVMRPVPPHRLADPKFREGFRKMAAMGLVFDAWVYHPQLEDVLNLARAFPETTIVLDHAGTPLGVGPYQNDTAQTFKNWALGLRALAQCPNVVVKVGGFGMPITGLWLHERPIPTSSIELADSLKPYVETCIEKFGPDRCMFESNFPVDKQAYGYSTVWNAFKRLTSHLTLEERSNMFSRNAARVYQGLSA